MCRKVTGALSVPFVAFPRNDIELAPRLKFFASSGVAKRIFCPECCSFVGMDYGEKHSLWLTMGSLNNFDSSWINKERDYQIFKES